MDNLGGIKSRADLNQKIIKSNQASESASEEFSLILEGEVNKTSDAVLNKEKDLLAEKNKSFNNNLPPSQEKAYENILNLKNCEGSVNNILQNFSKPFIDKKGTSRNEEIFGEDDQPDALYADPGLAGVFKAAADKIFTDKEIDLTKLLAVTDKNGLTLTQLLSAEQPIKVPVLVDIENIYTEIVKEVMVFKKDGVTRMRLKLEPEELGKMDVWLVLDNKKLSISIIANKDVKDLLQQEGGDLASLLGQAGYQLENFNFSSFGQQQNQQNNNENKLVSAEKREDQILNILNKNDIISNVNSLLTDIVIDYIV